MKNYWIKKFNSTDRNIGEFIAKYESVSEAARQTGINGDTIERQLKKPLKNPNDWRVKFIWKKEEIAAIAV